MPTRFRLFAAGMLVLLIMWIIFVVRILLGLAMTPAARLSAAIEVFADIEARRRPAAAGAEGLGPVAPLCRLGRPRRDRGPRLRRAAPAASSAWIMGADTPRAVLLGMLRRERGLDVEAISALADGARFAPEPLSDDEQRAPARGKPRRRAARMCAATIPNGSTTRSRASFGDERAEEGAALAARAPLDLRVNTLKATRDEAAEALADLDAQPTRWSPLRPAHRARRRMPRARRSTPSPRSSRA